MTEGHKRELERAIAKVLESVGPLGKDRRRAFYESMGNLLALTGTLAFLEVLQEGLPVTRVDETTH